MRKCLLLLLLLFPIHFAGSVCSVNHPASVSGVATPDEVCGVSGLAATNGGCTPETYISQTLDDSDGYTVCESTNIEGQAFYIGATKEIYSITIDVVGVVGSPTGELRLDDDDNLSADTLGSKTMAITAGQMEFIFDSPIEVTIGTYYFAVTGTDACGTARFDPRFQDATDPYDATGIDDQFRGTSGWDSIVIQTNSDLHFIIKTCQ